MKKILFNGKPLDKHELQATKDLWKKSKGKRESFAKYLQDPINVKFIQLHIIQLNRYPVPYKLPTIQKRANDDEFNSYYLNNELTTLEDLMFALTEFENLLDTTFDLYYIMYFYFYSGSGKFGLVLPPLDDQQLIETMSTDEMIKFLNDFYTIIVAKRTDNKM